MELKKTLNLETPVTEHDKLLLGAFLHFVFYINTKELFGPNGPEWDEYLKKHFHDKLTGYVRRANKGHCDIDSIVKWVQDMTKHNQEPLLKYIIKNHWDKW